MTPYVVLLIVLCVEGIVMQTSTAFKNPKKTYLVLAGLEMILFVGLRAPTVGSDTSVYVEVVEMYRGIPFGEIFNLQENPFGFETGYLIFGKICSFLNMNATAFLFTVAAAIYIPFLRFAYKHTSDPTLSVLAYFAFSQFYYSLGIFRQMLALSVCLLAVSSILERKPLKFCVLIAIATLFHNTAICWLPIYWLTNLDVKKYRLWVLPAAIICIPAGVIAVNILMALFPQYEGYLGTIRATGGGSYLSLLLLAAVFIGSFWISGKPVVSRKNRMEIAGLALGVILQAVAYSFGLLGRAICYYTVFITTLLPDIIDNMFDQKSRRILKLLVGAVLIFIIIETQFRDNENICPFIFFWEAEG